MALVQRSTKDIQAKGSWWFDTWGDGEGLVVILSCPHGHQGTLFSRRDENPDSKHHQIAADGTVSPSVQCPHEGCPYHEVITLANWTGLP